MKLYLVKQYDNSFKLAHDSDYELAKKIKPMAIVECNITQPRNVMFHRKFFALINLVYQNQEHYNDINLLRTDLIRLSGYNETHTSIEGLEIVKAKSISFSKMTELEFNNLYSAILDTIQKYFSFDRESVQNEINQHF